MKTLLLCVSFLMCVFVACSEDKKPTVSDGSAIKENSVAVETSVTAKEASVATKEAAVAKKEASVTADSASKDSK